jgi:hypothetical protein
MPEKKAILVTAGPVALEGGGAGIKGFLKKAVVLSNYSPGDVAGEAVKIAGLVKAAPEGLAAAFEGETALALVELGRVDAGGLDSALAKVVEAADRRTLVILAADNLLAFYGLGINAKLGSVGRPAAACDVVPTMAHIADLPIPDDATGAILYQVLKDPNMKLNEFVKLKEALVRMEAALQRGNREPWDKHDCA